VWDPHLPVDLPLKPVDSLRAAVFVPSATPQLAGGPHSAP
jgi:hypothetical protein